MEESNELSYVSIDKNELCLLIGLAEQSLYRIYGESLINYVDESTRDRILKDCSKVVGDESRIDEVHDLMVGMLNKLLVEGGYK